jgi:hypothetical protein
MGKGDLEAFVMQNGGDIKHLTEFQDKCSKAGIDWASVLAQAIAALLPILLPLLSEVTKKGLKATVQVASITGVTELSPGRYPIVLQTGSAAEIASLTVTETMEPGGTFPVLGVTG